MTAPRGILKSDPIRLNYLAVEISYGSRWVNLNDGAMFRIDAENTRDSTARTYRKTTTTSPVFGGSYLVHAVPDMVTETVGIWVYGESQTDLADNFWFLDELFTQYDYRLRWTLDEYRETWTCQLADATYSRGQVWTHSQMAKAQFTVPRYADVERESFE